MSPGSVNFFLYVDLLVQANEFELLFLCVLKVPRHCFQKQQVLCVLENAKVFHDFRLVIP